MILRHSRFDDPDDVALDDMEELLSQRFVLGLLEAHATNVDPARRSAAGPFVTHLLAETAAGIETLLSLQRRSLQPDADGNVPFHRMLHDICDQIEEKMRRTRAFDLAVDVSPACAVPGRQVVRLALIASELIINAIKHAHPAGAAGLVEIACRVDPDGTVVLTVCDDGIGLPEGFDPVAGGGLGMALIRTLSRQLRAVVTFESTGLGLLVTATVPPPLRHH